MASHKFQLKIQPHADRIEASLGAAANENWGSKDLGKALKLGALGSNYVLCADGDEIEGFLDAVEPYTVNDGFGFGTVLRDNRAIAEVGAATVAVGDYCVASAQDAPGTLGTAKVKTKVLVNTQVNTYKWRCIAIVTGTGAVGDKVLLERV